MKLLLASQNSGKLAEMRQLVSGLPVEVVSARDLGIGDAPEETGLTFLANARDKARSYSVKSGLLAVADDSGLCVDALGGEPGILSARYGGPSASDLDRNSLIIGRLKGLPEAKRSACFTCALVLARGDEFLFETEERVHGLIALEPRGPNGFGYDPIFLFPPFGRTFGEVTAAQKDTVSHRGQAFRKLSGFLRGLATG
jgi:XTP/dITP diphosphohydrolase